MLTNPDPRALLCFALTATVLAPLFEETLFRGVLLPALGERQDVAQLIDMLDGVMFTGSPAGTAQGSGKFLQVGDVVEAEIPGIGVLRNTVTATQ